MIAQHIGRRAIMQQRSASYVAEVVADGPFAYYRLEEATGNGTAVDHMGNINGTHVGGTQVTGALVGGQAGFARQYSSENTDLTTDSRFEFNGTSSWSIEFWIKQTNTSGAFPGIAHKGSGLGSGWLIYYQQASDHVAFKRTATHEHDMTGEVGTTAFKHVVITYDHTADELKGYDNGALYTTVSTALNTGTVPADAVQFGRGDQFFLAGSLDEVAFYSHALSAARVAVHYDAGA